MVEQLHQLRFAWEQHDYAGPAARQPLYQLLLKTSLDQHGIHDGLCWIFQQEHAHMNSILVSYGWADSAASSSAKYAESLECGLMSV